LTGRERTASVGTDITNFKQVVAIAHWNRQIPFPRHLVAFILLQAMGSLIIEINIGDVIEAERQTASPLATQLFLMSIGDIPVGIGPLRIARHQYNSALAVAAWQIGEAFIHIRQDRRWLNSSGRWGRS